MGFEQVMFLSVQFPDGAALDKMGFGDTGGKSKQQILQEFIADAQDALAQKGVGLTVVVPQGDETVYERRYGGDPNALGAAEFADTVVTKGFSLMAKAFFNRTKLKLS